MSILAQCGWGRGSKVQLGLNGNVIEGVIMSPRDERRERLEESIDQFRKEFPDAIIMFDPQFYATMLNAPRDGHLSEYDYYEKNKGLGRAQFSGSKIQCYVRESLDYQYCTFGTKLTYLISPTILFDDFRDNWSQVALNLGAESADYHSKLVSPQPLLISIVVSETAFSSMDSVEEFLDALTEFEVDGFYLIICHNANDQNAMNAESFGRFLYLCYVLAEINEYKVVVGYSDWQSFLIEAVGVIHTANGWYQNIRQFSLSRFKPSTGGRRPRKRYSSAPLLSCPLINPELQDIFIQGLIQKVLTDSQYDAVLAKGPLAGEKKWSSEIACLSHWFSLCSLSGQIKVHPDIACRIQEAESILQSGLALHKQLGDNGISFELQTGPNHIHDLQTALNLFRTVAGVQKDAN